MASSFAAGVQQLGATLDAFYRFTRPHTMLGTFVSILSVSIMAMGSFTWTTAAFAGLLQALVPALLMNISIVGINQIYDVDIDKVGHQSGACMHFGSACYCWTLCISSTSCQHK